MMRRILGIDPGLGRVGWGVIQKEGTKLTASAWGRIDTKTGAPLAERLALIADALKKLIARHKPSAVAVEELFFAKNTKTAITVSHARGAILLVAARHHLPVMEYTPLEVKQALTGYGRADKRQIQTMLKAIFHITIPASEDDAADALAIAYTAMVSRNL